MLNLVTRFQGQADERWMQLRRQLLLLVAVPKRSGNARTVMPSDDRSFYNLRQTANENRHSYTDGHLILDASTALGEMESGPVTKWPTKTQRLFADCLFYLPPKNRDRFNDAVMQHLLKDDRFSNGFKTRLSWTLDFREAS